MENKQLNEKESLELITRMISNTRDNLESSGLKFMFIWGYTTIGVSLLVYLQLHFYYYPAIYWEWFAIPLIGALLSWRESRKNPPRITTYVDRTVGYVWTILGLSAWLMSLATIVIQIPILFSITLLMSAGSAITGLIIKFKTLTACGIIGILASFLLIFVTDINSILIFIGLMVIVLIIPAHVLTFVEKKRKKHV